MKVLIADGDVVSQRLLQLTLGEAGYQVETAANGAEALRALQESGGPRLAVLSWTMPEMDGVEVCRALRKLEREPYVYIILLAARERQSEMIEDLEAGADDYITKPFDLRELNARLRLGKRILELRDQLVSARAELREQATHDSLTGVWNREGILELLRTEMVRSIREGSRVSVILADIDYFKRVNDAHGQQAGDAVLREAARRMQESLRPYDSLGRYGADKFLIVSPGCTPSEAADQAERLRRSVGGKAMFVPGGSIVATMSLGVATIVPHAEQQEDLLRAADEALYAAKKRGRNRVEAGSQIPA